MKVSTAIIALILVALLIVVAVAIFSNTAIIPNDSNVKPNIVYWVDNVKVSNTTIINWSDMIAGLTYTKNFTCWNQGIQNFTLTMTTTNLPVDWNQTWTGNSSLLIPNQTLYGNLTLALPLNAVQGNYNWTITVTETAP